MPDTTRHLHLPNGLHVTLRHGPHLTRAAAAVRVRAGSHDAPQRWPGLAHFLEHLLFLGTARFPLDDGLMRFVQGVGGQVNASTRERTTDFFFEVPCPAFAGALERLCQMLAEPELGAARQLAEREVIHAEFIAWSRDAQAQRQLAVLQSVSPGHPLRGFHAGNRYTLNVPSPAFQQALQHFHQQFYRGAQMTLSLCGPQSLEALQALAERCGSLLAAGAVIAQTPAPPLFAPSQRVPTRLESGLLFAHEGLPPGAEPALALLFHYLTDPGPGGWLAEMQRRQWLQGAKAHSLYAFAGQALWHLEFEAADSTTPEPLQAALLGWFAWLRQVQVTELTARFSAVQRRKGLSAGALQWARSDSSGQSFQGLDEQGLAVLDQVLAELSGARRALPPAPALLEAQAARPAMTDGPAEHWHESEPVPQLRGRLLTRVRTPGGSADPSRLSKPSPRRLVPSLGAAGTPSHSAHPARRPEAPLPGLKLPHHEHPAFGAPTAPWQLPEPEPLLLDSLPKSTGLALNDALHVDPTLPSHRQFACVRLRWRLPCPQPALEWALGEALAALQARAEQAGVTLRFDSAGTLWTLLCSGPPAAVIRASQLALSQLRQPPNSAWQSPPQDRPALMPIRALLEQLPRAVQGDNVGPGRTAAALDPPAPGDAAPASQAALATLWAASHWHGHATGFDPDALAALAEAMHAVPGQPATHVAALPMQARRWCPQLRLSGEHAVLLFCPVRLDRQAGARLLGHLLQGPVYQRLRVELQLGYAVFSAFRQVEGIAGLLFGVQSPHAEPLQILRHLRAVLAHGATLSAAAQHALAEQFDEANMTNDDLAHYAWQCHLAGEQADLQALRAGIRQSKQADIDALVSDLLAPDAAWLCLANGSVAGTAWP